MDIIEEQIKLRNMCYKKMNLSVISEKQIIDFVNNKKHMNGQYLKSLVCLFNNFLYKSKSLKPISIFNFIKTIKKIDIESAYSSVYTVDILSDKFKIVIKTSQQNYEIKNLYKEYYISIAGINNLRYKIPTFVYTFGIFKTSKSQIKNLMLEEKKKNIFIMNEQIIGNSFTDFMNQNPTEIEWLDILIQILISLELAQREIKFTHYDLHLGNILINKTNVIPYEVNFDNYTYSINSNQKPVIIDFGMSSITINDKQTGFLDRYFYEEYGIAPFMVSGRDMHRVLSCCYYLKKNVEIKKIIQNIYKNFYEITENIDLFLKNEISDKKNGKVGTINNKISSKTPLMLINWLITNYSKNLNTLVKKERINYINLEYCNYVKEYENFFSINEKIKDNIEHIKKCISKYKSYILISYNIKLLSEINKNLQNDELKNEIETFKKFILKRKEKYIVNDLKMLNKCFDIKINYFSVDDFDILRTFKKKTIGPFRESFLLAYKFIIDLEPYIDIYYTILETNLSKEYKEWLLKFEKSDIWTIYKTNIDQFNMIDRYTTLQSNILGYRFKIKKD